MPLPTQNVLAWHASIGILHTIAISSTLVRLIHRRRRLDLWWDDWATILPLICDVLYFLSSQLKHHNKFNGAFFTSYWLECILFLIIIWVSRTSLALSIARIFPPRHVYRRIAFSLTGIFLMMGISFTLKGGFEYYDRSSHEWWDAQLPLGLPKPPIYMPGVYIAIVCDFLADAILIIAPIVMLWGLKLPVVERRLVLVLFSCSFLQLASSAFFVSVGLVPRRLLGPDLFLLMDMGPQLECTASIIVCNLMVLATLMYRICKKKFVSKVLKSPPVQQNPPPMATPVRSATVRRGTSIFRDLLPPLNNPNRTVMTADIVMSASGSDGSAPQTSFTVPDSYYGSSEPTTSNNPDSQPVYPEPQSTNPPPGSVSPV